MISSCANADLVNRRAAWLLWGLPAALLIMGTIVGPVARTLLWTPALLLAGSACVVNTTRCHRLHCYLTGPLFLVGAFATILNGIDVLHIHWSSILAAMVVGTAAAYGLERVRGRYFEERAAVGRSEP